MQSSVATPLSERKLIVVEEEPIDHHIGITSTAMGDKFTSRSHITEQAL
jgi:hypothetical protein